MISTLARGAVPTLGGPAVTADPAAVGGLPFVFIAYPMPPDSVLAPVSIVTTILLIVAILFEATRAHPILELDLLHRVIVKAVPLQRNPARVRITSSTALILLTVRPMAWAPT